MDLIASDTIFSLHDILFSLVKIRRPLIFLFREMIICPPGKCLITEDPFDLEVPLGHSSNKWDIREKPHGEVSRKAIIFQRKGNRRSQHVSFALYLPSLLSWKRGTTTGSYEHDNKSLTGRQSGRKWRWKVCRHWGLSGGHLAIHSRLTTCRFICINYLQPNTVLTGYPSELNKEIFDLKTWFGENPASSILSS